MAKGKKHKGKKKQPKQPQVINRKGKGARRGAAKG